MIRSRMEYKVDGEKKVGMLALEGEMTILQIGEIKDLIKRALVESDHLTLDLKGVTEADLAFIQLLCSSHRTSVVWQKGFDLAENRPGVLKRAIESSGYLRHIGCPLDIYRSCIWAGGWE